MRWITELEWFFCWSGAELGERSTFPPGEPIGSHQAVASTPTAEQCAAARKQRRVRRVLLALGRQHQAVLEASYRPRRDVPPNLASRFGIDRKAAKVAWSMARALRELGEKVDHEVATQAQAAVEQAHELYAGARAVDELAHRRDYPNRGNRAAARRDRVQSFRLELDELVA